MQRGDTATKAKTLILGAIPLLGLLTTATTTAVFAEANPSGTGQPNVGCGEKGLGDGPNGFSTSGFGNADSHYAGSDGTPSLEHANSDNAVSQYDVACFQTGK